MYQNYNDAGIGTNDGRGAEREDVVDVSLTTQRLCDRVLQF
jgi:hypothetical protein